jgi:predicted dehydrogenase
VHVPAFRLDPRAKVIALAAASLQKASSIAASLDIPRAHATWQDLVADPAIGLVSIAVPPVLQPEIAEAAARHGKHLFLEKPLGASLDQVRSLVALVEAHPIAVSVDLLFARVGVFEEAARLIAAGEVGRVTQLSVRWRTRTYAHRMGIDSWKLRSLSGGGALYAFGSHVLQYVEALGGPIRAISARRQPDATQDDRLEAECALANGATASILVDTDFSGEAEHTIEVSGDRGSLRLENRSKDTVSGFVLRSARGSTEPARGGGDGRIVPAGRIVSELLDAIESGDTRSPRLRQGVRVQTLMDAAARSEGAMVEVPSS